MKDKGITRIVKHILECDTQSRDNNHRLVFHYREITNDFDTLDSVITRKSRHLQRKYEDLRGNEWAFRQRFARKFAEKYRSQEMPETCASKTEIVDVSENLKPGIMFKIRRFFGI